MAAVLGASHHLVEDARLMSEYGEQKLNQTHRWGQRPYFERIEPGSNRVRERMIPCCLNCLVDGFEDEPEAFQDCRRQTEVTK